MIKQACDMINKDQFTASITSLGLIETETKPSDIDGISSKALSASSKPNNKTKYIQVCELFVLNDKNIQCC